MSKTIKIAGRTIQDGSPIFIIAEAGVNHNGRMDLAKKLVDTAKRIGADAVKFQTFRAEDLVTADAPQADYQKKMDRARSQFEMLKKLELSETQFFELFEYCRKQKIIFLSTPFDLASAEFLSLLGVPAYKVGSGEITNFMLLRQVARYQKPIVLSTGMSSLQEVQEAVNVIDKQGNKELILLHCTSNYPTKFEEVNLRAMLTLKKKFNVMTGYSDHTPGIEVAIAATAMGACVIEKHLTLNRDLPGPDHSASLVPQEFQKMVEAIRNVEKAKGDGIKKPNPSEIAIQKVARKSLVAACDIGKGIIITPEMLTVKRPGTGIAPKWIHRLTGKEARVAIPKDKIFSWDFVR